MRVVFASNGYSNHTENPETNLGKEDYRKSGPRKSSIQGKTSEEPQRGSLCICTELTAMAKHQLGNG